MKDFISTTYTFTPGASGVGTVNLSGISGFDIKKLAAIINQTKGVIIYATGFTTTGYTNLAGSTLTLFVDTTGQSGSDILQVVYNDSTQVLGQVTANAGTNLNTSALALETGGNLANINTKVPVLGQALAASSVPVVLPDAQITSLTPPAAITGFNLETTQALVKAKTDNLDVALSTRLKPADTLAGVTTVGAVTAITNALPTGSNTIGKVGFDTANNLITFDKTNYLQSTGNNSSSQLAASATFIGTIESALNQPNAIISIRSDQPFTLTINQYSDVAGTIQYPDIVYTRLANQGFNDTVLIAGSYYRIRVQNTGAGSTTNLFIETWLGILPVTAKLTNAGNQPISVNEINGTTVDSGAGATTAGTQRVLLANEQVQDLYVVGQSAQTATVNNILTTTAGTAATDKLGYRSFVCQVVSTGTAGTFIFEGSNDNFVSAAVIIPVKNAAFVTGAPVVTAITATASNMMYTGDTLFRYIRLRIATTITGGSIQAFTTFSQVPFGSLQMIVSQNTAANLNATVTGTVALSFPGIASDIASAAITTTTTTSAIVPSSTISYSIAVPVTVVSGTTPTYDLSIEESDDTGTNWFKIYDFPRITATGFYRSPKFPYNGNRIRYVQTLTGTTPSFTRAINRVGYNDAVVNQIRQIIDRTIVLTTLNSATPSLTVQSCRNIQLQINIGTATTPPILQLEGSDDNGLTWYSIGSTLTAVASSTVQLTTNNVNAQLVRARVSTAGTVVVAGFVLIKGF